MLKRLLRLFRRNPVKRLTGVVQRQSQDGKAWIAPHDYLPIFEVGRKTLRRSGFLWDPLRAGDRVHWRADEGLNPRTVYVYRRAQGR